ncbi:hypothetical protein AN958_05891 [Leucoagaricus sp. SymC.cos]|nr:hypothetical protein AN958_05891 [Leucoagaricus sp. SymC.cos]
MSVNGRLVDSFSTSSKPQNAKDLATIYDLPTELLIRIFHAATESRFSDLTLMEASATLLSLSHVSHHSRAVLFPLPEPWGRPIDVVGFSEAEVLHFIKRSGMSSIELFVDGGSISRLTNVKQEDIQHSFVPRLVRARPNFLPRNTSLPSF